MMLFRMVIFRYTIVEDIAAVLLCAIAYYVVALRSKGVAFGNFKCEMNFTFRKMLARIILVQRL